MITRLVLMSFFLFIFISPAFAEESSSKMSTGQYVVGGVLGTYPGLGIGHAVQGRWKEKGWIFTTGELVGGVMVGIGAGECLGDAAGDALAGQKTTNCDSNLLAAGAITFLVFKVWEIIDVWVEPPMSGRLAFQIAPPTEEKPGMLSLSYRY